MEDLNDILQDIVDKAAEKTEQELNTELSSLIRLTDNELKDLLSSGINKTDLVKIIKEVKDSTKSNKAKAKAIQNISGGIETVIGIVIKFL